MILLTLWRVVPRDLPLEIKSNSDLALLRTLKRFAIELHCVCVREDDVVGHSARKVELSQSLHDRQLDVHPVLLIARMTGCKDTSGVAQN